MTGTTAGGSTRRGAPSARRAAVPRSIAVLALLALAHAVSAVPVKAPAGPDVDCSSGTCVVAPGGVVEWTITFDNPSASAESFNFVDDAAADACAGETAPASALLLEDLDLDGTCAEAVGVTGATGYTIDCEASTQSLQVLDLVVDAGGTCTLSVTMRVPADAAEGVACNLGRLYDAFFSLVSETAPPSGAAGECSCVAIAFPFEPSDVTVEKTADLEIDADFNGGVSQGDTIRWRVLVGNAGPGVAREATLVDDLMGCNRGFAGHVDRLVTDDPDGDAGSDASTGPPPPGTSGGRVRVDVLGGTDGLLPGETVSIDYLSRVDGPATCCNRASVSWRGATEPSLSDDPSTPALALDATCAVPQRSKGRLLKSADLFDADGDGVVGMGDTVVYQLAFTNMGAFPLTDVVVLDSSSSCVLLDALGATFDPPTSASNVSTGTDLAVALSTPFMPGETVSITFVGTMLSAGTCCNRASWRSAETAGLSDLDGEDAVLDQAWCHEGAEHPDTRDLDLRKVLLDGACLNPGAYAHYRLDVTNLGADIVPGYHLDDVLDGSLWWNPIADPPLDIDPTVDLTGDGVDDFRVFLDDARPMMRSERREFTYQAQVPCTESGSLLNVAALEYDGTSGVRRRTAASTVRWGLPDLSVSRVTFDWDDADGDQRVDGGETIHFEFAVTNASALDSCPSESIVVTDQIDPRFDGASVVVLDGGTWSPGTRLARWSQAGTPALAGLPPGGEVLLHLDARVDPAATTAPDEIPHGALVRTTNFIASCLSMPALEWYVSAIPGVPYGDLPLPSTYLLRNDFVSCRADATATLRAVLRQATDDCSDPPAIDPAHAQTDAIPDPVSPVTFSNDALPGGEACPQNPSGDGGILVFYEIQSACAQTLRVRKVGADVEVSF